MNRPPTILLASPQGYLLAGPTPAAVTPEKLPPGPLFVCPPFGTCISATVSTANLPRSAAARRQALLYRLEEHLPLPAEELAASFLEQGDQALGLAIPTAALSELLAPLQGRQVQAVCPLPLLAHFAQPAENVDLILWHAGPDAAGNGEAWPHVDALFLRDNQLFAWDLLPSEADHLIPALSLALQSRRLPAPRYIVRGPFPEPALAALERSLGAPQSVDPRSQQELALTLPSDRVLPLDLAPPETAPATRSLRRAGSLAAAAAAIALLAGSAAMWVRAAAYDRVAADFAGREARAFHEALPSQNLPLDPLARLVSEARRLQGATGASTDLPSRVPATATLASLLAALPADLRFELFELRLSNGGSELILEGNARSHTDAEFLAAALRSSAGLAVDNPRTEESDGAVSFTLNASRTATASLPGPLQGTAEGVGVGGSGGGEGQ